MTPDDRQRAADKAAKWRTLEGVALGKVEETRLALRRAGEYSAWLEEEWAAALDAALEVVPKK